MPTVVVETFIVVDRERLFDMARDISLHQRLCAWTHEKATEGVTSGLIEEGQTVTFRAVHLGVRQTHTSKIVAMKRPAMFSDEMVRGTFKSFCHLHEFEPRPDGTLMRDTLTWTSPLGLLGHIADALFLRRYMTRFLRRRNAGLKRYAEASALPPST